MSRFAREGIVPNKSDRPSKVLNPAKMFYISIEAGMENKVC